MEIGDGQRWAVMGGDGAVLEGGNERGMGRMGPHQRQPRDTYKHCEQMD